MRAGAGAIHDQNLHSFRREKLIDLFRQLPPKDQRGAPTRLIENALRMSPHHFDSLSVRDLLLWQPAVFAIDQRKNHG
jgi:hypothetical protein